MSEGESRAPEFDALRSAAQDAFHVLERVAGTAQQLAHGAWDNSLTPEQAQDLADRFGEMAEVVRTARAEVGQAAAGASGTDGYWSSPLPFNRKERFYTGTVLPALVSGIGFWHVQRLLDLCGVPASATVGANSEVQLLTEYGFAESVHSESDQVRWGTDSTRETPDVVIVGPDWLLALEAKMYHAPSAAELNEQMAAQAKLIERWRTVLGFAPERVVHALLLPERLAERTRSGLAEQHVVTWQELLAAYRNVGPHYWVSVLADALERHPGLESKPSSQRNAEAFMTGEEILRDAARAAPFVRFVGRVGGATGTRFLGDVASGSWRTRAYQVRGSAVASSNPNWMPLSAFQSAVDNQPS